MYLLYRTHPSEAFIDRYDSIFKDIKNIIIISGGSVLPFIFHSDLILQRNCTTALESWLAGKSTVQLEDDDYFGVPSAPEHNEFSHTIRNIDELDHLIRSKSYKTKTAGLKLFLENNFHLIDGKAHIRISEEIQKCLNEITDEELSEIRKNILTRKKLFDNSFVSKLKNFF